MESYAHEAAQDWLDFIAGSRLLARRLIRYEYPLRSLLALFAWISIVRQPARLVPWCLLGLGLVLRDALSGDDAAPQLARPQLSFSAWAAAVVGARAPKPPRPPSEHDLRRASTFASASARRVAYRRMIAERRRLACVEINQSRRWRGASEI